MAVDEIFRFEVEAITDLMDQLDYYQLLKVEARANPAQIQAAYFQESKLYHPDRYFSLNDPPLKERILKLYKRISEAYGVLKDPESRQLYDQQLARGGPKRFDRAAFEAASARGPAAPEAAATTATGKKFLALGLDALKREDFQGAIMNLQFALNAEPQNKTIQGHLQAAKQASEDKKKSSNPYKVRL